LATPDGLKKLERWGYQAEKKFDDIFIRFDTVLEGDWRTDKQTDKRTDGQTPDDG